MDLRIITTANESFEFNDNRAMRPVSAGNSYNSVSSLIFDAEGRSPTTRFNINSNLSYRTFAGPGEENSKNVLEKGISGRFQQTEKLTTYNVQASWREFDSATVQLEEIGVATLSGTTVSTSVGGGLTHRLNPRDSISWQTNWSSNVPQGGTTNETLSSNVDFTHSVNAILTVDQSVRVQQLTYSGRNNDVLFSTATAGLRIQPLRQLSVRASAGANFADNKSTGAVGPNPSGLPGGKEMDWLANLSVTYDLTRQMKLGLTAARGVSPDTFGQFSKNESVGASLAYVATQQASVFIAASYAQQTSAGIPPSQNLSASISYAYRLAREWSARTTYRFAQRHTETSSAQSNSVLLVLTRDYVVLP
jgi:hypothetical protein